MYRYMYICICICMYIKGHVGIRLMPLTLHDDDKENKCREIMNR